MKQLSIVVPCYNEQEALPHAIPKLLEILQKIKEKRLVSEESSVYFVDDGSRDDTWRLIEEVASRWSCVHGIKLSGNRGHQFALLAGLMNVPGDIVVSLDADLQDDVGAVEQMVLRHQEGAEIVYGVRADRQSDTIFKKFSAQLYYRLLGRLGVDIVFNHADYRLLSRPALTALAEYREVNLFLRGLIPKLGFKTAIVEYVRHERIAGESKYPLKKMLSLAWNGITSFSAFPLRLIAIFGVVVAVAAFIMGMVAIYLALFTDQVIPGWTSIVVPMFFLGGVQLLAIGLIGEYIGKIYMETKARPRYHIEKII